MSNISGLIFIFQPEIDQEFRTVDTTSTDCQRRKINQAVLDEMVWHKKNVKNTSKTGI